MMELHSEHSDSSSAAVVEDLLRRCGDELLSLRQAGNVRGEWKGEQYKAEADLIAHNFLVDGLQTEFPDIPIVSEEDEDSLAEQADDYFIIDPIDGTASFAEGFPGWVSQIAYVRQQVPILAGIYAPASGEYFEAIRGKGAFCNRRRLQVGGTEAGMATIIDNYPEPRGLALDAMRGLGISHYLESGSIGLKICRIADGSADLFIKDMMPRDWDIAAPMLILKEAGGILVDLQGQEPRLGIGSRHHSGLIATRSQRMLNEVAAWLASRK